MLASSSVSKPSKAAAPNAYETNPYAFYQISQRQLRISRKMRVKTPSVGNSKNQGRQSNDAVSLFGRLQVDSRELV